MNMLFWKAVMLASAVALLATEAAAQSPFTQCDEIIGHLAKKCGEGPAVVGASNKGSLVEALTTGDGSTWSIIVLMPDGTSCLVAASKAWRTQNHDSARGRP